MKNFKVWVEIHRRRARSNFDGIKGLLKPGVKLWSVVKSNAYGHGLIPFASMLEEFGVDGFCVDSVIEGVKLKTNGIKKDILVLGAAHFGNVNFFEDAAKHNLTITISTLEGLQALAKFKNPPAFHLKVDTGMHRQGFYVDDMKKVAAFIKSKKMPLKGVYTHFASSKDLNYPAFTDFQFHAFKKACAILESAGFKNLVKHAAATGGTLVNSEYHLDAVRVGIGLYGLWPSRELELQRGAPYEEIDPAGTPLSLSPVLSWHALVSEVKIIPKGGYVGYDLAERVSKKTVMAVVPIGYWHGFDRKLSHVGEVIIKGNRARVLGRVSMDIIVVDVTSIPGVKAGDTATLIGENGSEEVTATEFAGRIGTSHYEVVTRINPLIERVIV